MGLFNFGSREPAYTINIQPLNPQRTQVTIGPLSFTLPGNGQVSIEDDGQSTSDYSNNPERMNLYRVQADYSDDGSALSVAWWTNISASVEDGAKDEKEIQKIDGSNLVSEEPSNNGSILMTFMDSTGGAIYSLVANPVLSGQQSTQLLIQLWAGTKLSKDTVIEVLNSVHST